MHTLTGRPSLPPFLPLSLSHSLTLTQVTVVHRALGSSSTNGATQYLAVACPEEWKLGYGKTISWPQGAASAQGSGGVSSYLSSNPCANKLT